MSHSSLCASESDELAALETLYEHADSVYKLGSAQEQAQQHALQTIDSERRMIEEALRELDVLGSPAAAQKDSHIVGLMDVSVRYTLPLLSHEDVHAIPLLRTHADERRRVRALLSSPPWSARDSECLQVAVQNEQMRQHTLYGKTDALDWDRVAMQVPFHTANDCQTRWQFVQCPSVNHARWSSAEKKELFAYVDSTPNLSWEEAAAKVGTGRTGYQALEMYQRSAKRSIEWTPELDQELVQAARTFGPDWKTIAQQLGYPVGCAFLCHQRHNKLKSSAMVMGRWSAEEDAALRAAVAQFGCDWKRVEICVHGRTGQQCRERWVGRLANIPEGEMKATRRTWTKEEDDRLRACVDKCQTWVEVAEYVGGRTDKMVRERWLLLKRHEEEEARRQRGEHIPAPRRPKYRVPST